MPNTLVHLGLQGALTRAAWRRADLAWVYLGCLIPDFPWMLRRVALAVLPGVDALDLKLYTSAQSSLAGCLLLAAAFAAVAARAGRTFALLAVTALGHLLLDAAEIKWSNGVHLLAPFSWELTSYGVVWPEHGAVLALSMAGLAFVAWHWRTATAGPPPRCLRGAGRWTAATLALALYFALPPRAIPGMIRADNYGARTLLERDARPGRPIATERRPLFVTPAGTFMEAINGERIALDGVPADRDGTVSVRGVFTTPGRIRVDQWHLHPRGLRDGASALGIALVGLVGLVRWKNRYRR